MQTPIPTKIADLPQEFVVEVPVDASEATLDSLKESLRSQILYNSRFEEEELTEDKLHVNILKRNESKVTVRIERAA